MSQKKQMPKAKVNFSQISQPTTRSAYRKSYIMNQVNCILSLDRNRQTDYRNVSELFDTYNKVLADKSDGDFKNSIKKSKESFEKQCFGDSAVHKYEIEALEKNNASSFLIVPLVSTNHLFCAVVRKTDEGFSATLVNASKGGRRGDDRGSYVGYQEYVFANGNEVKLLDIFEKLKHGFGILSRVTNEGIYKMFENAKDTGYPLNIVSRDQKDGNCYVKEPEKAIKFALDTSNLSLENIKNLRNLNKKAYTPKWPMSSREVHDRYIKQLIKENPKMKDDLTIKYHQYLQYKDYIKNPKEKGFNINGRSIQSRNKITYQDSLGNDQATAEKLGRNNWNYFDIKGKPIGYALVENNEIKFYNIQEKLLVIGQINRLGEKYYTPNKKLIGFSRRFYGMQDYNGDISKEHKGFTPVDCMLNLNNTIDIAKSAIKNNHNNLNARLLYNQLKGEKGSRLSI
jgi:hypothetical protein